MAHPDGRIEKDPRPKDFGEAMTIAARERAKTLLLSQADRLRKRAHALEALAYATEHVHGEAEEALWDLACAAAPHRIF